MVDPNYTVGKGRVYFSKFRAGTQIPEGFLPLGNAPELNLTAEPQMLDHFSSQEGIRQKDKSILLELTMTGSLILDDIQLSNLALFFLGEYGEITQAAATGATETLDNVRPGAMYQLGATTTMPAGVRKVSNVTVQVGASPAVLDVDYMVNGDLGLLTVIEGSTIIIDGADISLTYDVAASTRSQVVSGTQQIEGALKFVSANAAGDDKDWLLPYVKLSPNGDFGLISEEWQQLPLSLEVLKPNDGRERIYVNGRPVA
jgi:hypothetical protein